MSLGIPKANTGAIQSSVLPIEAHHHLHIRAFSCLPEVSFNASQIFTSRRFNAMAEPKANTSQTSEIPQ
jgi:hypothetical protein